MKAILSSCLFAVLTLIGFSVRAASPDDGKPMGFRLTIDLRDGSRIVGKSRDDIFKFNSDILGDMKLPLDKVRSVDALTGTNLFKLTTANADTIKVLFKMDELRLSASFGDVALPVEKIRNVRVSVMKKAGRPMDGLIGLWSGDGNAKDSVGGNDGVLQNVGFTDGVAGQAFLIAPNNYPYGTWVGVKIPDRPQYALTHSLTIDAWIRSRGNSAAIITRGDNRAGFDPYSLGMMSGDLVHFTICNEQGTTASVRAHVESGQWVHVAGVLDDATGTMSLYTNGVLAAQTTTTIRPIGQLQQNLSPGVGIGNVNDGFNNFPFVGELDEIGLYDRALTEDEVRAIYAEHEMDAGSRAGALPTSQPQPRYSAVISD